MATTSLQKNDSLFTGLDELSAWWENSERREAEVLATREIPSLGLLLIQLEHCCVMGDKASVPMQRNMVELEAALNSTVPTVRAKLVCAELKRFPLSVGELVLVISLGSEGKTKAPESDGWTCMPSELLRLCLTDRSSVSRDPEEEEREFPQ